MRSGGGREYAFSDPLNRFGRATPLPAERAVGRAGDFYLEFSIPGGGGPYPT